MMGAILNSPILNSAILDSAILQKLWLKLIQSHSNSFILTQLDDGSHLEFCHLEFGNLGFSHLSFSSQTHSHLPRLVPTICTKKPSLIHSDSPWWWQPSWILLYWIQTLPSWIQTPCFLLSDSLKNTLPPLWLWLKLTQSDSNSFILTQLDDGSHLEFCHVGLRHLVFFSQIHSKALSLHSDSWLKLIQSDSNSFILTQLDDGSHLEFHHLGFDHLSFSSQTPSHLPRLDHTICTKKTFTLSFWLNLMMAAILNSTILDSDTAILDSDTFLSSLRFIQNHSHSTLNLTQTNSIWLKLIHSDSMWWWQPSSILPSWIWPSWIQPS